MNQTEKMLSDISDSLHLLTVGVCNGMTNMVNLLRGTDEEGMDGTEPVADGNEQNQSTCYMLPLTNNAATEAASMLAGILPLPISQQPKINVQNPYTLKGNVSVLEIIISAPITDPNVVQNVTSLISTARSRGIIIRTSLLSDCGDLGGQIAVQGTPGFRIIHENVVTTPYVQMPQQNIKPIFGFDHANKKDTNQQGKRLVDTWKKIYLQTTKLSPKKLQTFTNPSTPALNAQQCIKYGLADWILTRDGNYVKNLSKVR